MHRGAYAFLGLVVVAIVAGIDRHASAIAPDSR